MQYASINTKWIYMYTTMTYYNTDMNILWATIINEMYSKTIVVECTRRRRSMFI